MFVIAHDEYDRFRSGQRPKQAERAKRVGFPNVSGCHKNIEIGPGRVERLRVGNRFEVKIR